MMVVMMVIRGPEWIVISTRPTIIPRIIATPIIPIVVITMPMIIVSIVMIIVSPVRTIIYVVRPRTHPSMVVIIVPTIVVVENGHFCAFLEIDVHVAIIGDMRGEIGIVETTDALAVLEFLVFFGTNQNRIRRRSLVGNTSTIVFVHITCSKACRLNLGLFYRFIFLQIKR